MPHLRCQKAEGLHCHSPRSFYHREAMRDLRTAVQLGHPCTVIPPTVYNPMHLHVVWGKTWLKGRHFFELAQDKGVEGRGSSGGVVLPMVFYYIP